MECTRQEFMAIATGRELKDGELAIFGVGLSMLAGYFAKKCHAPNLKPFTEGGIYGSTPVGGLPWGIECNRLCVNATSFTGAIDALGFVPKAEAAARARKMHGRIGVLAPFFTFPSFVARLRAPLVVEVVAR